MAVIFVTVVVLSPLLALAILFCRYTWTTWRMTQHEQRSENEE